jgi:NADH:ubiquinone oxidoreductase subunit E
MKTKQIELGKLDKIFANYKGEDGALISVLNEVQTEFGWISPQAVESIADALKVFPSQVYSVATFCPFLLTKPQSPVLARRL